MADAETTTGSGPGGSKTRARPRTLLQFVKANWETIATVVSTAATAGLSGMFQVMGIAEESLPFAVFSAVLWSLPATALVISRNAPPLPDAEQVPRKTRPVLALFGWVTGCLAAATMYRLWHDFGSRGNVADSTANLIFDSLVPITYGFFFACLVATIVEYLYFLRNRAW